MKILCLKYECTHLLLKYHERHSSIFNLSNDATVLYLTYQTENKFFEIQPIALIELTFEGRTQLPDSESANAEVLTESKFEKEHRNTGKEECYEVRYQESACRIRQQKQLR